MSRTAPPGWRRPGIEIGYNNITDAGSVFGGIAVHLRITDSGSEVRSRRYFTIDNMQCRTDADHFTGTRDTRSLVRGLVRDLKIEGNDLYHELAG